MSQTPRAALSAGALLLLAVVLHAAPAAAASASATQTPSAPVTAAATVSPSATFRPGVIATVAGNGELDVNLDDGPAMGASLWAPSGVAVDGGGNVLIADGTNRIRRVAAGTGVITTVAGNGAYGFSGDGGPGTSASLAGPSGVAVDGGGNVLIADTSNYRIRRLAAGTGIITTVAGTGVAGFSGDGGPATSASLWSPTGVAVDGGGNVFIVDSDSSRIRRVAAGTGVITTVAGNGTWGFSGDGGPGTSASLSLPCGLSVDRGGNVLIADLGNNRIRRVAAGTGIITTLVGSDTPGFSGDGGPGTSASLWNPRGVAVDGSGNVLIVDSGNHRIRLLAAPTQPSPPATPSPSSTPYCQPSLFRPLPRTDLVGALVGTALAPGESVLVRSEAACRQACCDAAACDGYAFDVGSLRIDARRHAGDAHSSCFLYANISQLVPVSIMASGIRESALL